MKYEVLTIPPFDRQMKRLARKFPSLKAEYSGARVITHFYVENETVYLLAIYNKSEQADISDKELIELLSYIEK